jgi:hypothetical protein
MFLQVSDSKRIIGFEGGKYFNLKFTTVIACLNPKIFRRASPKTGGTALKLLSGYGNM